jgi:hypothetical protein
MRIRLLVIAAGAATLAACTSTTIVRGASPGDPISGTVLRSLSQPTQVEIRLDGRIYRGEWYENAPGKEQRATTGYPHRRHVGVADATLFAADGSTMTCHWETHARQGEGICKDSDGRDHPTTVR